LEGLYLRQDFAPAAVINRWFADMIDLVQSVLVQMS
jgi:hypothetical protein